jgi:ClpP class serine protease
MTSQLARRHLYERLERERDSKVIAFITGDRPGLQMHISSEVYPLFTHHLDRIGAVPKISLFLHTRGGDTMAAWSIINLIRQFCDHYEVIVPMRAQSAGTLMCLGAKQIIMTKQAMLGPIDPSITNPLNPTHPTDTACSLSVSVEFIQGYFGLATEELGISDQQNKTAVFLKLAEKIHPLVLGQAFRVRSQIQSLARKLLAGKMDESKVESIVAFLCADSGSHDYPIHRREAESHGLPIEKPSPGLYQLIQEIYNAIEEEIQTALPLDAASFLGPSETKAYSYTRSLIESVSGGTHAFLTQGQYTMISQKRADAPDGVPAIQNLRTFEGWKQIVA